MWSTYNAQNQITETNTPQLTAPEYDAAGEVTNDGQNRYLYDAEGRICAAWTPNGLYGYLYDAAGNRVAKGTIHQVQVYTGQAGAPQYALSCDVTQNGFSQTAGYVVGPGGEQLTEVDGNDLWRHTNIWAGGKLIGTYDVDGLHFHIDDPLGTRRAQVSSTGALEAVYESLPFGNGYITAGTAFDPTENHFTGKERDAESGNDYMFARYYNSATGRFLSPDWSAKEDPVPYAKMDNPQSLNLYSYVYNNPLGRADADGHCPECVWEDLQELEASPAGQKVVNAVASAITAGLVAASGVGSKVMNSLTGGGSASYAGNGYELAFDIMYSGKSSPVAPAPAPSSSPQNNMGGGQLGEPDGPKRGSTEGRGSGQKASPAQREEALKENGGNCVFCGKPANEADHSIPKSRGGDNTTGPDGNLQPTCTNCNRGTGGKHSQTSEEFLKKKQEGQSQ